MSVASSLDNIPRIKTPTAAEFHREYVLKSQPVVLTDLFDGEPIREIDTIEAVSRRLGQLTTPLTREIMDDELRRLGGAAPAAKQTMRLDAYLERSANGVAPDALSIENPIPAELDALFMPPRVVKGFGDEFSGFVRRHWFAGVAGTVSAMHFDGDICSVLHYQAAGRKRHILAHPREAVKLAPVTVQSTTRLANFSDAEKLDFARYLHAYDTILAPGEAIFMPAQFWHHVEYVDDSFSFNFRWGRNRFTKYIHENVHRNWRRRHLASLFFDLSLAEGRLRPAFDELVAVVEAPYDSVLTRYRAVDAKVTELYERLCTDRYMKPYLSLPLDSLDEKFHATATGVYGAPATPLADIGRVKSRRGPEFDVAP